MRSGRENFWNCPPSGCLKFFGRVSTDGSPPLYGQDIRSILIRIRRVCEEIRKYEWYRAGLIAVFRLLQRYVGDGRLFLLSEGNKFTVYSLAGGKFV